MKDYLLELASQQTNSYNKLNVMREYLQAYAIRVLFEEGAFRKFPKLQFEAGISSFPEQNISIKVEIDTNPPLGAQTQSHIINKYFPLSFISYDVPSLVAGKIHALLSRKYTKGRDYFDLGWYLSRWKEITPNFTLLINALKQTHYSGIYPTPENWRHILINTIQKINWKIVIDDFQYFLENPSDLSVFTKDNLLKLLKKI